MSCARRRTIRAAAVALDGCTMWHAADIDARRDGLRTARCACSPPTCLSERFILHFRRPRLEYIYLPYIAL